jgi:type VI secretion system secreted protein VgrG
MPSKKTQSGLKSESTKGGGGYNELMFEDKKGSEKIVMHAQKDHEVVILHSEKTDLGAEFKGKSTSRKTTLINGTDELLIQSGNQEVTISDNQSTTIGSNQSITIGSNQSIDVAKSITITAFKKITLQVGASSITLDPGKITLTSPIIALSAAKIQMN